MTPNDIRGLRITAAELGPVWTPSSQTESRESQSLARDSRPSERTLTTAHLERLAA